jgi:hypothetical protein
MFEHCRARALRWMHAPGLLTENREEILSKARARVALRSAPLATEAELTHGLPLFLDQLGDALRRAKLHEVVDHAEISTVPASTGSTFSMKG